MTWMWLSWKTHWKDAVVAVVHQATWPGWGDHCFWAFVVCGKFSKHTPPIIKNTKKKHALIPLLLFCFLSPLVASLIEVMWIFSSSRLLVCDACCGLSVGAFKSASPTAVEPQNKRLWRWAAQQALGALAASASNWGKICGTWSLLVGSGRGGVTPPHFPLLLWCHWWSTADPNPLISTLHSPKLKDYVSWDIHPPTGFDFWSVNVLSNKLGGTSKENVWKLVWRELATCLKSILQTEKNDNCCLCCSTWPV